MILDSPTGPPLTPGPEQGRSWLRHELLHKDYQHSDIWERFTRWLSRLWDGGVPSVGGGSWVPTLVTMALIVALVVAIGLLASRARRSPGHGRTRRGGVITGETTSAADLRARADAAYAAGEHATAVVEGFRALARRQVERGRLADDPGLTADEVARSLEHELVVEGRALEAARLFDEVLYGERPATAEQAGGVLALERELAVAR